MTSLGISPELMRKGSAMTHRFLYQLFTAVFFVVFSALASAGSPLWVISPLTATNITVPENGSGTVQYTVANQSAKPHHLAMLPVPGVTSASPCQLSPGEPPEIPARLHWG